MTIAFDGFDWDPGNWPKCGKHGLEQAQIESAFAGPVTLYDDSAHSTGEVRLKAIGRTQEGRWVLIAFTLRERSGRTLLRPISARYMHAKEIEHYEQEDTSGAAQRRGR